MNPFSSKISSIVSILVHIPKGEFKHFLYEVGLHTPDWFFRFNSGYIFSTVSPRLPARNNNKYEYQLAAPEDFKEIEKFSGISVKVQEQRIKNGDMAFITKEKEDNHRIVTIQWIHCGPCFIRGYGLMLPIEKESAYFYGALSAEDIRYKGVFNSAFQNVIGILRARNIRKYYALVEFWNTISRNYHIRSNFEPVMAVDFIKIFGMKILFQKEIKTRKRSLRFVPGVSSGIPII
nr:hypothetical protein [candidate division Zixibacteria bacterium]